MPPKERNPQPKPAPPGIPILSVRKEWTCPNCQCEDVTEEARPHTRMHTCPALGGLTTPLVEKERCPTPSSVQVRPVVREDYVGKERGLTFHERKPIMSVVTEYADGSNDVAVFAPTATADGRK